ncbi:carbon storage regulator [Acidiferrobacter sp.]|uniref:carbon storage regulator n=1 Tax=Acidiferrobacter sp. TaxID=1872107 RepID=UPI002626D8AE|nr:carbon storage regulator [Acidiferrobacter sp.]
MLLITRRHGERILIDLDPRADPQLPAADLFAAGPLEILVMTTARGHARLAVTAPRALTVRRAGARIAPDPPRDAPEDTSI